MKSLIKYVLVLVAIAYGISYVFGPLADRWQKDTYQKGVDRFVEKFDRYPDSFDELSKEGFLNKDPKTYPPKEGGEWMFDNERAKIYIRRPALDEEGNVKKDRYGDIIYERIE